MDEASARAWVAESFDVPRETMAALDRFASSLREENERQNLVSRGTTPLLWSRHIADSAQLLRFADKAGSWLDLGSGAGFPGLIVAALSGHDVTLVEERRLRVAFLAHAAAGLGVRPTIIQSRIERVAPRPFDVISARAFAPLPRLLALAAPFSSEKTRWLLPRGKNAESELAALDGSWHGDFRLEPSVTDPEAWIIVAAGVRQSAARAAGEGKQR